MIIVKEGEKAYIGVTLSRSHGSGAWALTGEQYRILDSARALVTGYDWAAAIWDAAALDLYALLDSTVAVLLAQGTYYMQFRGTIGSELYEWEVRVQVQEVGP
jgi:hypothetical protein